MTRLKKFLPFIISLVLILVLVSYAPWDKVGNILSDFDWQTILILVGLSLLYYGLKTLRFWYLLRALKIDKPLSVVALSYISAQPVSLLPAGEVYRSHALRRYAGIPVRKSIGQFTLQGILEGGAMAVLMLIAALALGRLRIPALIILIVVVGTVLGIKRGYMVPVGRRLNSLPFINVAEKNIESFSQRNRSVLTRRRLPPLFALSIVIELVGGAIAYTSVAGIGGHINVFQAILLYIVPVIVGFISFLPGGFGLSEQSAIGLLYLSNVTLARAVAATLIMRVTIVGLGVLYGVIALIFGQSYLKRKPSLKN